MKYFTVLAFIGFTFVLFEAALGTSGMEHSKFLSDNKKQEYAESYPLENLYVDEDRNGLIKFSLNATGCTIYGLDQPQVKYDKLQDTLVYNYETINITGHYAQDGVLLIILPTFGNGDFKIIAKNITLTVNGESPDYDYFFYVDDVDATFENYLGGGLMELLAQLVEPTLGDAIFKFFEPNIWNIINSVTKAM